MMWGARYGPLAWRLHLLHFPGSLKGFVNSPDLLSHPSPISIALPQLIIYDLQTYLLWFLIRNTFVSVFLSQSWARVWLPEETLQLRSAFRRLYLQSGCWHSLHTPDPLIH